MSHEVELRPSLRQYRSQVGQRALIVVPLIAVYAFIVIDSVVGLVVVGAALLVLVPAVVLWTIRYARTARLQLRPGWIRYTRWNGNPVVIEVARTRGLLARQPASSHSRLMIVAADGSRLARLNADLWTERDLRRAADLCGYPHDPTVRSAKDWEARLPGSTTWIDRHPIVTGIAIAGVIVALILFSVAFSMAFPI
ncbi:hypothetical protein CLV56_3629 [Mumia flava]|uniref:Uncharacterized protein n=1 Tax=Mumia flava TaxID=1348852 RepID=A0A0B2B2F6_9ACTN|nr:hypothetical protein CLV56_3629 [Mumia flava]